MKELNIEEKARRYDEAYKVAKNIRRFSSDIAEIKRMEEIFPELKESEDERIRKEIIAFLKEGKPYHCPNSAKRQEWAAWLEKQGEQKSKKVSLWKHWKDGITGNGKGKLIYLVKVGNTYRLTSCLGFECDYIELSELDKLLSEKQGKQKSADKVEPKFKSGDWVVWDNKISCHIDNIYQGKESLTYTITDVHNMTRSYSVKGFDNNAHLWTIQDAKDGDVLHSPSHRLIWIYKDNEHYYACVNMNYVTENTATNGQIVIPNDTCPATKDEYTILFAKMKEAGYEWDAEKKELKKIEQSPIDVRTTGYWYVEDVEQNPADKYKEWYDFIRYFVEQRTDDYTLIPSDDDIHKWGDNILNHARKVLEQESAWSEEDKNRFNNLIFLVECSKEGEATKQGFIKFINKLKSLRPQNNWKPSDEQMRILDLAIRCGINRGTTEETTLVSLFNDLKKLKG